MAKAKKKLQLVQRKGKSTFIIVFGAKKPRKGRRKRTAPQGAPISGPVGLDAKNGPPRPLGAQEQADMAAYLVTTGESPQDAKEWLKRGWFAAFDYYITDSPGYTGRVIVAIWPAAPEAIESFIYRAGKLEKVSNATW